MFTLGFFGLLMMFYLILGSVLLLGGIDGVCRVRAEDRRKNSEPGSAQKPTG